MSEGYSVYSRGECVEPGRDKPRAKKGWQNGKQRYKAYCENSVDHVDSRSPLSRGQAPRE